MVGEVFVDNALCPQKGQKLITRLVRDGLCALAYCAQAEITTPALFERADDKEYGSLSRCGSFFQNGFGLDVFLQKPFFGLQLLPLCDCDVKVAYRRCNRCCNKPSPVFYLQRGLGAGWIYFNKNLTASAGIEARPDGFYVRIKTNLFKKIQPLAGKVVGTGAMGNVCAAGNSDGGFFSRQAERIEDGLQNEGNGASRSNIEAVVAVFHLAGKEGNIGGAEVVAADPGIAYPRHGVDGLEVLVAESGRFSVGPDVVNFKGLLRNSR